MTLARDSEELPGGVLITVKNAKGEDCVVDQEEYNQMVADNNVIFPASTNDPMTLEGCFPGIGEVL